MIARTFYFIRHGETDWNRLNQFQGHTDVPLNDKGRAQALEQQECLVELGLEAVFASPLSRARDTAEILNAKLNLPFSIDPGLKECGCPDTVAQIYRDLGLDRPDFGRATLKVTESEVDFIARSVQAVDRVLNATDKLTLIVAHGGTYWALCKHFGQNPGRIPNCTPVCFEPLESGWKIRLADSV
jgi:probable phosphoglycerate mutase